MNLTCSDFKLLSPPSLLFILCILFLLALQPPTQAQESARFQIPQVGSEFGTIPKKFEKYEVILGPDRDASDWWAGAPSVVRDGQGIYWLACRMRTAEGVRGRRGYEIRILRSEDGIRFARVHSILREEVPIPGFERPALLLDSETRRFKLYACGPWREGPWCILKFDDVDRPDLFKGGSARPVIQHIPGQGPEDPRVEGYKDPVIIFAEGMYHCFTIGVFRSTERIFLFTSADGERWKPVGHPNRSVVDLSGWHDFSVRPASVVPIGPGYLFVYEGSSTGWRDPVYQIATGLAFTFDLSNIIDLTPRAPLLVSTTPSERFRTWRYSHWMAVENEIRVYAEVEKPNGAHEIRLFRLSR